MKKLIPLALAFVAIGGIMGCSGGDTISDEQSIGADLKKAGVKPEGEPKDNSMPKADDPPKTTG